jgi:hypothetical protein
VSENRRRSVGRETPALSILFLLFVVCTQMSLTVAVHSTGPAYDFFWQALWPSFSLLAFIPLFLMARFSFGYFAGVSLYSTIIGFFWLSYCSAGFYDDALYRWSAVASFLMLLLPVLLQTASLPRLPTLSSSTMSVVTLSLVGVAILILAISASFGFAFVGLARSEALRGSFPRPVILNYAMGAVIGGILPFCFAFFACRRRYGTAACVILVLWGFYPVALNKTVLFGGLLLPVLYVVFRFCEPRKAVVLALTALMIPGIVGYHLLEHGVISQEDSIGRLTAFWIGSINGRLFAVPAIAMDAYSNFFSTHQLTYFCQIRAVRFFTECPYQELGVVMASAYNMGNLNASLFATEGLASVGPLWAPLSAFVCGVIISLGNTASANLPAPLVGTSSGIVIHQALMNTPLSISLLSNGLLVLWLLWSLTPRDRLDEVAVDGSRENAPRRSAGPPTLSPA